MEVPRVGHLANSHQIETADSKSRLEYLDALRGFAALYVVLLHISLIPKPSLPMDGWLNSFVSHGGSGVSLFFVISGFSMCLTWGKHERAKSPFSSFMITRLFRIAPLFYTWLVLFLVRDFLFKGHAGLHTWQEIAFNASFLFNLKATFRVGIVWASWTIGVEMLFYLVFPAYVSKFIKSISKTLVLLLISLAIPIILTLTPSGTHILGYFHGLSTGVGFLVCFPIFILGIVAFHLCQWLGSVVSATHKRALGFTIGIASVCVYALIASRLGFVWYIVSACCYSGILIAFSLLGDNLLINRASIYIGRISYSLYLNHPNTVYIMAPLYFLIYNNLSNHNVAFVLCVFATLCVLVPMSNLTYRYIELPMMNFGKGVTKRLPLKQNS